MKNQNVIICIGILFTLIGCIYDPPPQGDNRFIIFNNSGELIYCYPSLDGTLNELSLVLDNSQGKSGNLLFDVVEIPPDSSISIKGAANWNSLIKENGKDSTITLFVFSKDLVKDNGLGRLGFGNHYTKKMTFTEKYLDGVGWKINYRSFLGKSQLL